MGSEIADGHVALDGALAAVLEGDVDLGMGALQAVVEASPGLVALAVSRGALLVGDRVVGFSALWDRKRRIWHRHARIGGEVAVDLLDLRLDGS
jgi:hypothetical protein